MEHDSQRFEKICEETIRVSTLPELANCERVFIFKGKAPLLLAGNSEAFDNTRLVAVRRTRCIVDKSAS